MDINRTILTGRIATNPTLPQVNQDGKTSQTFFTLAVQQGNNAMFFPVVYFFTNNQVFAFLKKGRKIAVEGHLHSYNQKVTINTNRILFLDKAPTQQEAQPVRPQVSISQPVFSQPATQQPMSPQFAQPKPKPAPSNNQPYAAPNSIPTETYVYAQPIKEIEVGFDNFEESEMEEF